MATPSKWPGRAAPSSGPAIGAHGHRRVEARRVDLVHGRGEHDIHPRRLGPFEIATLVARVALEVRGLAELLGFTKIDIDDRRALRPRPLDERDVALVEPAHGRHEADGPRGVGERRAELGSGADDAHAAASDGAC